MVGGSELPGRELFSWFVLVISVPVPLTNHSHNLPFGPRNSPVVVSFTLEECPLVLVDCSGPTLA